jgi:hypothetical protein
MVSSDAMWFHNVFYGPAKVMDVCVRGGDADWPDATPPAAMSPLRTSLARLKSLLYDAM